MASVDSEYSCVSLFKAMFEDTFAAVALPQSIVIQNRRLGFCSKFLQFLSISVIAIVILLPRAWLKDYKPEITDLSIWPHTAGLEAYLNDDVPHCKNVSDYALQWDANRWFRPSECRFVPFHRLYKQRGADVFLPTYIHETIFWTGQCSDHNRDACSTGYRGSEGMYFEDAGTCRCTIGYEYFVKNPEETKIYFVYGVHVELENGQRALGSIHQRRDKVKEQLATDAEMTGHLLTRLKKYDGSPCVISNKSEYSAAEAAEGIGTSIKDLLACAGVTLDTDPRDLVIAGKPASTLRVMGMNLNFDVVFNYPSAETDGITSDITVSALPVWNAEQDVSTIAQFEDFRNGTVEVERKMYGITPVFSSGGSYKLFSWPALMQAFVNATVILSLPGIVTTFLALYCVGSSSVVFRKTVRRPFNIFRSICDSFMKMFIANATFRFLTDAGSHLPADETLGMSGDEVYNFIFDVFKNEVSSGTLSADEISTIVSFLMKESTEQFDDHDGGSETKVRRISFHDFLSSCVINEPVPVAHLLHFLDVDRRRSCLEVLFDDTSARIKNASKVAFFQSFDRIHSTRQLERIEEQNSSDLPDWALEYLASLEKEKGKQA
eukprot:TRINITY_DN99210_c0_g1_i1.p1 TRINITY_DN99210_c0_g1~~TRINITY_DN99210_c0_g1_i1.p1  ORF type:complete len:606 (+),score=80.64 TRINITY_DN99210_c0_g1_i1:32-1849(+)